MAALRWTAWAMFGIAGIGLVMFVATEFVPMLGAAISVLIAGMLLLGFDRALCLLTDIRDALNGRGLEGHRMAEEKDVPVVAPRDAQTLGAEIAKRKGTAS